MNFYDITGNDCIDPERHTWLLDNLDPLQYEIYDRGFIYSEYVVRFTDPKAEIIFIMRWL